MVSPIAFGLGPLETIVNVGWGSPVYVSVYCVADVLGLSGSGSPSHIASVALSAAAIERNCEIVLSTGGTLGDPYFSYIKLVVIKVPSPSLLDVLFTLTLSGSAQQTADPAPDYFCGSYSQEDTIIDTGTYVVPGLLGLPDVVMHRYSYTHTVSAPDGILTNTGNIDIIQSNLAEYLAQNPNFHIGTIFASQEFLSYYNDGGHLVNTGIPCDSPPVIKIDQYPFSVEVVVNPVKDHVVSDPGGPFFLYDPGAAVKVLGSGLFGGDHTSIWRTLLNYRISQGAPSGLTDGSYPFKIQKSLFAIQRKEKIIEVYPSAYKPGNESLTYRGAFRLNTNPPSGSLYLTNWDGTGPDFINPIILYGGSSPPPVPYSPDSIPF